MIDRLLGSIRTSLLLGRSSLRAVGRNRELLLFPLLLALVSLFGFAAVLAMIFAPVVGSQHGNLISWLVRHGSPSLLAVAVLGQAMLFPYLAYVVACFFNVAQAHACLRALRGEPVSVPRAFRYALSRLHTTLAYAGLAAAVAMLLAWPRALGRAGARVFPWLLSFGWWSLLSRVVRN